MKVFDLHCPQDHVFEGWFASEADFRSQTERGLVECPLCGSTALRKGLSAPRLNLGAQPPQSAAAPSTAVASQPSAQARQKLHAMQAAWLQASRQVIEKTEDVGDQFSDQALRMHKGEEPARAIRGQATPEQAMELLEEGVPVMPLALPKLSKETLQ